MQPVAMGEYVKRASMIVRGKLLRASGWAGQGEEVRLDDELSEELDNQPVDPRERPSARDLALAVLEVDRGASADEVRDAYRRLCRRYHPDFFSHDEEKALAANELLVEINRAYELLSQTAVS